MPRGFDFPYMIRDGWYQEDSKKEDKTDPDEEDQEDQEDEQTESKRENADPEEDY